MLSSHHINAMALCLMATAHVIYISVSINRHLSLLQSFSFPNLLAYGLLSLKILAFDVNPV